MSTSAERQRKRRARLKTVGIVDVTVPVPLAQVDALRQYARQLCEFPFSPTQRLREPKPQTPPPAQSPAQSHEGTAPPEPVQAEDSTLARVIAALELAQSDLAKYGVQQAGVYGAVVHGDDRADAKIEIVIGLKPGQISHAITKLTIKSQIERVIGKAAPGAKVGITDQATMTVDEKAKAEQEAVYAF